MMKLPYYLIKQNYLTALSEQADNLCDNLFEIAVELSPVDGKFDRICSVLERAIVRSDRRRRRAGLVF